MRIFLDALLLVLILFSPWYVVCLAAIGMLFAYDRYYEIIFAGLIMDGLYNGTTSFGSMQYLMTLSFSILFVLAVFLRSRLKFYS